MTIRPEFEAEMMGKLKAIECASKRELLVFLIGVAQQTEGADVWRALFASLLAELGDQ